MVEKSSLKLWTVAEVEAATGLSTYQILKMVADGKIVARRVGGGRGTVRIPNSEVLRLAVVRDNGEE